MKFTLPITYQDDYIPKGLRTPRHCTSQGSVEVEIAEVERSEAPIIHIVGNTTPDIPRESAIRDDFTGTFRADGEFTSEVVLYEGEYYSSLFDIDELEERVREENGLNPFYSEGTYSHSEGSLPLGPGDTKVSIYEPQSRADIENSSLEVREWIDNYDTAASLIAARARDLIIVDGKLHAKVDEPVLSIDHAGRGSQYCVLVVGEAVKKSAIGFGGDFGHNDRSSLRFGLDEVDLAREFLAKENGIDCTVLKHVSSDVVLFRNDDRRLFDAAKHVISSTKNFVATTDREFAVAWNRLHMSLRPGHLSQQSLSAIREFLDCCADDIADYEKRSREASGTSGLSSGDSWNNPEKAVAWLVDALTSWDQKTESDLDWMETAMGFEARFGGGLLFREITNARDLFRASRSVDGDISMADAVVSGNGFAIVVEDKSGPYALARAIPSPEGGYEIAEIKSKSDRYEDQFRSMIENMLPEDDALLSVDIPAMRG